MDKKIVVLYHGDCPDGFGAAYAAWKKFGDSAEYIPLSRGDGPHVEEAKGNIVYMLDYTHNTKEEMDEIEAAAASFTVLDHHQGVSDITKGVKNHIYDEHRSGAGIAWDYFHPDTPRPKLIHYLEDDDLFIFKYDDTRPILAYLGLEPFTFTFWDEVSARIEDPSRSLELLREARAYGNCFEKLAALSVRKAHFVEFEGYACAFANAHPYKPIKSLVGNILAKDRPPIALVVSAHPLGFGVSIRSNGTVDVSAIARKYGGDGHPNSAGFHVPADRPLPWKLIEDTK